MNIMNPIRNNNSVTVKAVVVAVLVLLMLIPISMVKSLINERDESNQSVRRDITAKWGGTQVVTGPILAVPYSRMVNNKQEIAYAYFLPEEYNVDGVMQPEKRSRGVYDVLCYQSKMKITGKFKFPDTDQLKINSDIILWDEAFITLGITHLQGISNKVRFSFNGAEREITSDIANTHIVNSGLIAKTPINPMERKQAYGFDLELSLNGSDGLYFIPVGKHTDIQMKSDYKTVAFIGDFLPSERSVDSTGFTAKWTMYDYNFNFKPAWIGQYDNLSQNTLGVDLLLPVDQYQKTMRSAKYAILFIALTFLVFFMVELLNRNPVHPVQYLLISFALVLFYSLLLAFSEHIGFELAYLISSLAVVILISAYSYTIFKRIKQALIVGVFLSGLYSFLYVILQAEDMSLLIGSIGLFVILAIVMFASRKVNWYKEKTVQEVPTGQNKEDDKPENNSNNDNKLFVRD